jgi:hypothetical protein
MITSTDPNFQVVSMDRGFRAVVGYQADHDLYEAEVQISNGDAWTKVYRYPDNDGEFGYETESLASEAVLEHFNQFLAEVRVAVVAGSGVTEEKVARYLPSNYQTAGMREGEFGPEVVIAGTDNAGWTMEDYIIPRLASGWYTAREVKE